MAVRLVNNKSGHNSLGLLPEEKQFYWKRWATKAPNNLVKIKRSAYKALEATLSQDSEHQCGEVKDFLTALSDGSIDKKIHTMSPSNNQMIQDTVTALKKHYDDTYILLANTIAMARVHKYGFSIGGKGKIRPCAQVIMTLSHLYDGKKENPVLPNSDTQEIDDFLCGGDGTHRKNSKEAIDSYCEKLAQAVQNVMYMKKSRLDMQHPADNQKLRLAKDLKRAANRFFEQCGFDKQFVNIDKVVENVEHQEKVAKRQASRHHFWKNLKTTFKKDKLKKEYEEREEYKKLINVTDSQMQALNAKHQMDLDGQKIPYQLMRVSINKLAESATVKKQRMRNIKIALFALAILFAFIVALGQAAIAVSTLAGFSIITVGLASFSTNFFLFMRDIKEVFLNIAKGKMFRGLPVWLTATLCLYSVFSFGTGFVSGALAFGSLVHALGYSMSALSLSLMPGGLLAVAAIVGVLTVIGMGAVFFNVGVGAAQSLKNKTLKSLFKNAWKNLKSFVMDVPGYNSKVIKLKAKIKKRERELPHKIAGKETRRAENEIKFLMAHKHAAQRMHPTRHWIKVGLTFVFVPFAFIFAIIVTFALGKASYKETVNLLHATFKWTIQVVDTVAGAITWGLSAIVNGGLYAKNLIGASVFFADKLAKFFASVGLGIALIATFAYYGKLGKAIYDGYYIFKKNPAKIVYPSLRAALLVAIGAAVVLNAQGNAEYMREKGTIRLPDNNFITGRFLTYLAAFFGSATLNFMACEDATNGTPIRRLKQKHDLREFINIAKEAYYNNLDSGSEDENSGSSYSALAKNLGKGMNDKEEMHTSKHVKRTLSTRYRPRFLTTKNNLGEPLLGKGKEEEVDEATSFQIKEKFA